MILRFFRKRPKLPKLYNFDIVHVHLYAHEMERGEGVGGFILLASFL